MLASKESGKLSYDEKLVERQFQYSIIAEIREETIKNDIQTLTETYKSDEHLTEGINDIVRRQQERPSKLKTQSKTSKVNAKFVEESEIVKELKALRLDVNEIKKKQDTGTEASEQPYKGGRRNKCNNCQGKARKCSRCWGCGGTGHCMYRCPGNENRSLEGNHIQL